MSRRGRFLAALLPSILGICLGVADIAFAGTNAKGCTTKLFIPDSGPIGVLCANPGCPQPCTVVSLGGGLYVCGCPSNPGSAPYQYMTGASNNCTTFVNWDGAYTWGLTCVQDNCSDTCDEIEERLTSGWAFSCRCPGGT